LKPAWANSSRDPILKKKTIIKKKKVCGRAGLAEWLKVKALSRRRRRRKC
jgi:hypothetical protein